MRCKRFLSILEPSTEGNLSKVNDRTPGDGHGQAAGVRRWPRPMGDGKKQPKATTPSPDKDEAEELRRLLQSDDVAPVDCASYGRRAAQIIQRAMIGYWRKH